jgi:hypothetical protein
MTLQVAFVGTDGIVLASDRKIQNGAVTYLGTKIRSDWERGVVTASSGVFELASNIAKKVIANVGRVSNVVVALETLAKETIDLSPSEWRNIKADVLVVLRQDLTQVFRVTAQPPEALCIPADTKISAPNRNNAAPFFLEKYYKKRTIRELVGLAAHAILMASELTESVEDLDISLCTSDSYRSLTRKEIASLRERSRQMDEELCRSFAQEFA